MKKIKDKGISVNERRQYKSGGQEMNAIVQQLVKYGNTKSDAIKMTRKHYNDVLKRYKEPWFIHPIKKAEIISSLSANESVNEYSGMSKWQKDRLDQRSKEKAPKGKKVSKALQKKRDAWAKKYYTKGGGINIAKWKKDGSPRFPKESVNEAGMELNKIKDAILMFQKKIKKQGRITNARDAEHLERLIKLYKQMGGKGVKEGFGGDLKGKDKKEFEKARKENAEQLGYELTGKSDIRESDLPTTSKKEKTIRAVHKKSGKEVVYVDTPSVRKKLKRMGFVVKESVNEANMAHVKTSDIGKKKMRDLVQFIYHVLDLAPNKDFRLTTNGKLLSVNVDKINSKSIQNIKRRYGVDLKESINEAINHPKVQKQANQLAKVLKNVVAAAKKDDRKLARKLVGNIYDIYNDLDWTIQRDLRYKESVNEAPGKSGKDQYVGNARVKVEPYTYKNQKRDFHDVSMYRDHKKPYHYYLSIRLAHSNKVDMVIDTGTHIQSKAGKWAQGFIKRRMSGTGKERFS